jgi:hypothetical protein
VDNIGLVVAFILGQTVKDADGLPNVARDEVAEQSNVCIGNVIVADAAIASVTDVILGDKTLFM